MSTSESYIRRLLIWLLFVGVMILLFDYFPIWVEMIFGVLALWKVWGLTAPARPHPPYFD